ncbi:Transmembrane secretion effector [Quadrisphaera granulorum]|uniref:Transmembrane secretion effector n=1 Tax=Quadrisphaera granulorum TaxID=317664 RepID=A0A315ZQJ7_9ACTN|nr:MFS transporter [Quadrisphaera granulorum]PWJ47579.1 transmembrane secretion effector [Quadrisphaera granulorum]SZE98709.1 Transmembrane secretion effector [Quadrisphaera granulorum]
MSAAPPSSSSPGSSGRLGADYWHLWTASTAANLGDGVRRVAFPLLAVSLTRDPVLVSAVAAATTLPWLLVGPLAGLVVDRVDRVRLLWAVNAGRTVVVMVLVAALATGHASIGLLIGAALLLGIGEAFVDDAAIALVPRCAPEPLLERANAHLYGAQVVTGQFVGQGITGALFAVAVVVPFAVDAAALLVATVAALVLSGRLPGTAFGRTRAAAPPAGGALRQAYAGIAEGIRWLLGQRLVRSL